MSGTHSPKPSFRSYGDRFKQIAAWPDTPPEAAQKELEEVGAEAAQLYCRCAQEKWSGFDLDIKPSIANATDLVTNFRLWVLAWRMLVDALMWPAFHGAADLKPVRSNEDMSVAYGVIDPLRWRGRADLYGRACDRLQDMIDKGKRTGGRPRLPQEERDRRFGLKRKWEAEGGRRTLEEFAEDEGLNTKKLKLALNWCAKQDSRKNSAR